MQREYQTGGGHWRTMGYVHGAIFLAYLGCTLILCIGFSGNTVYLLLQCTEVYTRDTEVADCQDQLATHPAVLMSLVTGLGAGTHFVLLVVSFVNPTDLLGSFSLRVVEVAAASGAMVQLSGVYSRMAIALSVALAGTLVLLASRGRAVPPAVGLVMGILVVWHSILGGSLSAILLSVAFAAWLPAVVFRRRAAPTLLDWCLVSGFIIFLMVPLSLVE